MSDVSRSSRHEAEDSDRYACNECSLLVRMKSSTQLTPRGLCLAVTKPDD